MANKKIEIIKNLDVFKLDNPFAVEIIPNEGNVFEKIGEAIITFSQEKFNVYLFKGFFKKKHYESDHEFKFSDIVNVEFGKYSFKHLYVKIDFSEEKYIVFSYYFKLKNYAAQTKNIEEFFSILLKIQKELQNNKENDGF